MLHTPFAPSRLRTRQARRAACGGVAPVDRVRARRVNCAYRRWALEKEAMMQLQQARSRAAQAAAGEVDELLRQATTISLATWLTTAAFVAALLFAVMALASRL